MTGGPQSVGKRSALTVQLSPPIADQSPTVLQQVFADPSYLYRLLPTGWRLVGDRGQQLVADN